MAESTFMLQLEDGLTVLALEDGTRLGSEGLAQPTIVDDFSGGDIANLVGRVVPIGSAAWQQLVGASLGGTIGIVSGAAAATASAQIGLVGVATGLNTMKVEATVTQVAGTVANRAWLLANVIDSANYYSIRLQNAVNYVFYRVVAGVATQVWNYPTVPAAGDVLAIVTTATTVSFFVNGALRYSEPINATLAAGTKAGIGFQFGTDPTTRLDNFSVTPV